MLHEARRVTLYDDIVRQIRSLISSGQLKPGDKLPPERELAEQLAVSRPTLREVLKSLSLIGILEIRHGAGIFVREDLAANVVEGPLRFLSPAETGTIVQILEARDAIETAAARYAALRATEKDITELRSLIEAMEASIPKLDTVSEYDAKFHLVICRAANNPMLLQFARVLQRFLRPAMKSTILIPSALASAVEYHWAILDALEKRDPTRAAELLHEHLEQTTRFAEQSTLERPVDQGLGEADPAGSRG